MMGDKTPKKLMDLRVIDLKSQLEHRGLEKTGVKAALMERLRKALEDEGKVAEEVEFDVSEKITTPKKTIDLEKEGEEDDALDGNADDKTGAVIKNSESDKPVEMEVGDDKNDDLLECESSVMADAKILDEITDEDSINVPVEDEDKLLADEDEQDNVESETVKQESSDNPTEVNGVQEGDKSKGDASAAESNKENKQLPTVETSKEKVDDMPPSPTSVPVPEPSLTSEDTLKLHTVIDRKDDDISLVVHVDDTQNDLDNDLLGTPLKKTPEGETAVEKAAEDTSVKAGAGDATAGKTVGEAKKPAVTSPKKVPEAKKTTEVKKVEPKKEAESPTKKAVEKKEGEKKDGEKGKSDSKITSRSSGKDDKGSSSVSSRNLWVSGLSSATRATDLKTLFSKHGKVVGAKVVTNPRSPGSRCYGFVTMSSTEEASRCIQHLHRTELHARMVSVERAKNEPSVHPVTQRPSSRTNGRDNKREPKKDEKKDNKSTDKVTKAVDKKVVDKKADAKKEKVDVTKKEPSEKVDVNATKNNEKSDKKDAEKMEVDKKDTVKVDTDKKSGDGDTKDSDKKEDEKDVEKKGSDKGAEQKEADKKGAAKEGDKEADKAVDKKDADKKAAEKKDTGKKDADKKDVDKKDVNKKDADKKDADKKDADKKDADKKDPDKKEGDRTSNRSSSTRRHSGGDRRVDARRTGPADRRREEQKKADALSFHKIKAERERERLRQKDRWLREEERRRTRDLERERMRQSDIARQQREESDRLAREREKIKLERDRLERERLAVERAERDGRMERERRERERAERDREEARRQAQLRLEAERRPPKRAYDRGVTGDRSRDDPYWQAETKRPTLASDRPAYSSFSENSRFETHREDISTLRRGSSGREQPREAISARDRGDRDDRRGFDDRRIDERRTSAADRSFERYDDRSAVTRDAEHDRRGAAPPRRDTTDRRDARIISPDRRQDNRGGDWKSDSRGPPPTSRDQWGIDARKDSAWATGSVDNSALSRQSERWPGTTSNDRSMGRLSGSAHTGSSIPLSTPLLATPSSNQSFLTSAANIMMGVGMAGNRSSSGAGEERYNAYKSISGGNVRRY